MTTRWFPDEMPFPAANAETAQWWEYARQHQLMVQRCEQCGRTRFPPSPLCPRCRSWRATWVELPGTGVVYTFTVVRQPFLPALAHTVPYVVVVVDLEDGDGVRFLSNLVDTAPEDVSIGMPVSLVWEDMSADLALPRFARVHP
jgi:uncharacterized OB-fold protein